MDELKERVIQELTEVLCTPAFKALTPEEVAVILYQDVVGPYIVEIEKHFSKLAYSYGPYKPEGH